jgi:ammonia channel protein AmtB
VLVRRVVVHWGWAEDGWASAFRGKGPEDWVINNNKQKLFHVGVIDFAGSGIVHMVGGVAAFVSAWMIGPRHGRFVKHYKLNGKTYAKCREQPLVEETEQLWMEIVATDSGEQWCEVDPDTMKELVAAEPVEFVWASNPFPCQSATFQTFGCLILWFGWYGFNGASTLGLTGGYAGIAAKVMVNTTMAAAAGALTVGLLYQLIDGVQDLGSMSNGILAGLVSITSACSTVEPWAAIVCGIVGGIVYYFAVILLEKLRIDDVVLAVPVHCFCGIWGVIAAGLFPSTMSTYAAYGADGASASDGGLTCGLFYGGTDGCSHGGDQFAAQIVFVLAIIAWVGSTMFVLLFVTKLILGAVTGWTYSEDHPTPLAYNRIDQMYGMDVIKHGGMAAPESKTVHDEPTIAVCPSPSPHPTPPTNTACAKTHAGWTGWLTLPRLIWAAPPIAVFARNRLLTVLSLAHCDRRPVPLGTPSRASGVRRWSAKRSCRRPRHRPLLLRRPHPLRNPEPAPRKGCNHRMKGCNHRMWRSDLSTSCDHSCTS